jgi:septal ring factor EnvC (AmiA/AmiB activator)
MAEDRQRLEVALDKVQSQIDEVRARDPAAAAQLESALGEARGALRSGPLEPQAHRSIVEQLSAAVEEYEAEHPRLAANLGGLIDALSQMGI